MDCVTPSQPEPIPHGLSQTILDTIERTAGGTLFGDQRSMDQEALFNDVAFNKAQQDSQTWTPSPVEYRSSNISLLQAQNAINEKELKAIERELQSGGWDWGYASASDMPTPAQKRPSQPITETARVNLLPRRSLRAVPAKSAIVSLPLRRAPEVSSRR